MGTINKGILGGFSGKVGNIVGGRWKGIDYMRSLGSRRTTAPTERQKEQQMKFALIARFLQPLANLLAKSFRSYAIKMTGINSAMSYNLRRAVMGTYPVFSIDYSKILISRGSLPNGLNPVAESLTAGTVNFSWLSNAGVGKALDSDKSILVAYCPSLQQCVYSDVGPTRSEESALLDLSSFSGLEIQTWIGFISEDEMEVATSIFTGAVTVL
jgi:hypothetical protein